MHVAENLHYLMKLHKISGKDLADAMDLKATVISSYKTGVADPPLRNAVKIAEYFNVTLDDFVNTDISTAGYKEKPQAPNDQVIIDLLTKEVIRLRAEKINGGSDSTAIDEAMKATIDQLREDK